MNASKTDMILNDFRTYFTMQDISAMLDRACDPNTLKRLIDESGCPMAFYYQAQDRLMHWFLFPDVEESKYSWELVMGQVKPSYITQVLLEGRLYVEPRERIEAALASGDLPKSVVDTIRAKL
jgi:hypothetical protein